MLWVLILEKAWAKVNGAYDLTDGGYEVEALGCLTGAPQEIISHREVKDVLLWNKIKESLE